MEVRTFKKACKIDPAIYFLSSGIRDVAEFELGDANVAAEPNLTVPTYSGRYKYIQRKKYIQCLFQYNFKALRIGLGSQFFYCFLFNLFPIQNQKKKFKKKICWCPKYDLKKFRRFWGPFLGQR
jgi:hypothetical protein